MYLDVKFQNEINVISVTQAFFPTTWEFFHSHQFHRLWGLFIVIQLLIHVSQKKWEKRENEQYLEWLLSLRKQRKRNINALKWELFENLSCLLGQPKTVDIFHSTLPAEHTKRLYWFQLENHVNRSITFDGLSQ